MASEALTIRRFLPVAEEGPQGEVAVDPGLLLLDPLVLLRVLAVTAPGGQLSYSLQRLVIQAAPGAQATSEVAVRQGWVGLLLEPWSIASDLHAPEIVLDLYLDKEAAENRMVATGLALTRDAQVPFWGHWLVKERVIVVLQNGSTDPVVVTLDAPVTEVEGTFWRDTVMPVLEYQRARLEAVRRYMRPGY